MFVKAEPCDFHTLLDNHKIVICMCVGRGSLYMTRT